MGRVIEFPGGGSREPREVEPPLIDRAREADLELMRLHIETAQLQRDQLKADFKRAQFLWLWFCLKRVMFWGVVLWLLATCSMAKADPQRVFRDAQGRTIGTATTSGNQTTFRDARGSTTGTATTDSQGTTTFRDARGRTTGTSTGPVRR